MSDKILTDDEKDALLDGVTTGEVEVQSSDGPTYAEVRLFEVPERSRIATNSYPRLQRLNKRFSSDVSKLAEQMLNAEVEVKAGEVDGCSYGEFCDRNPDFCLVIEFSAKPLPGSGLVYLGLDLVRQLVESFYGGVGNEPANHAPDIFTRGETSVASLFCKDIIRTLAEVWRSIAATEHEQVASHQSTDLIDGFDNSDTVISASFDIDFSNQQHTFHIVWPTSMLASLLPVFEGQKRERDPTQDALWEQSIRSRITDSVVGISSRVGHSELTLGAVAELQPGDVIDIDNPRKSTVFVKEVPILEGLFGVHEGRYAIEAKDWLNPGSGASA
jgi:flagellar motor switch protein FliM